MIGLSRDCKKLIVSAIILLVVAGGVIALIGLSDAPLACTCTKSSAALEWISDHVAAGQIVADWRAWNGNIGCTLANGSVFDPFSATSVVTRGILIDFVFIVIYVFGLRWVLGNAGAALVVDRRWPAVARALQRAMYVAGALDVLENIGILLEVHLGWFVLAPVIAFAAVVKWLLVLIAILFIVLSIAYCFRIRGLRRRLGYEDARQERRLLLEFNRY